MDKKSILIFGVGELQKSIINRAKLMGLYVVGIDPCEDAACRNEVDAFEVVGGQDYEGTLAVAKKYNIAAVVTAATDKPLVMMARIAYDLGLRFYSEETAIWSTDKYQMKQRFIEGGVPCARGRVIKSVEEVADLDFPLILKPRDNSGSRGVILCRDKQALEEAMAEALQYTRLDSVLVEEFIEGREFSIESLHYDGKSEVIQFTEKKTTEFPYNVELGHKQPASLTAEQQDAIREIVAKISSALHFENCPSHTELKINDRGIFVIETSPRLGGDYITSTLTPLSTGINIEDLLLHIALGEKVDTNSGRTNKASGVRFFDLSGETICYVPADYKVVFKKQGVYSIDFKLNKGDEIPSIKSSLNRYGQLIVFANTPQELEERLECCYNEFITSLIIK